MNGIEHGSHDDPTRTRTYLPREYTDPYAWSSRRRKERSPWVFFILSVLALGLLLALSGITL